MKWLVFAASVLSLMLAAPAFALNFTSSTTLNLSSLNFAGVPVTLTPFM